jgi:hypothetical protein
MFVNDQWNEDIRFCIAETMTRRDELRELEKPWPSFTYMFQA